MAKVGQNSVETRANRSKQRPSTCDEVRRAAASVWLILKKQVQKFGRDGNELESLAEAARDNVKQMVEVMGEMKGAAMKVGQLLSTDPDIIDSGFAERLATLQRTAPPMDYMTLVNQFESALDTTMNDAFSFFDGATWLREYGQVRAGSTMAARSPSRFSIQASRNQSTAT